ncbi:MAG: enolase C-terminal domain-like protein, partial [Steroidobacteraceae bacterium]
MQLTLRPVSWRLREPFVTAREAIDCVPALVVELRDAAGNRGRGEAVGVDYAGESPASMLAQLERLRGEIGALQRPDRALLACWLPAGGARNALDAASWDLEAKASGIPAWQLAGMPAPRPLVTAYTIGIGDQEVVSAAARAHADWPLLKVKVDALRHLELVRAVRESAPRARLIVDANGSWNANLLAELGPELHRLGVEALEQPLPAEADSALASSRCPVPLCADESFDDLGSLNRVRGRYGILNLKLDKTG